MRHSKAAWCEVSVGVTGAKRGYAWRTTASRTTVPCRREPAAATANAVRDCGTWPARVKLSAASCGRAAARRPDVTRRPCRWSRPCGTGRMTRFWRRSKPFGVGGDPDRVDPVARVELRDGRRQVVADGSGRQEQVRGDVGDVAAARGERKDLQLPGVSGQSSASQADSASSLSMTRRPIATERTAFASLSEGASFSRKPLTLASRARRTVPGRPRLVRIRVWHSGQAFVDLGGRGEPVLPGRSMSMTATSGGSTCGGQDSSPGVHLGDDLDVGLQVQQGNEGTAHHVHVFG